MRVLLLIPPTSDLNSPYPSTAFLTGFLRRCGHDAFQADLSLSVALRVYSTEGLRRIHAGLSQGLKDRPTPPSVQMFLNQFDDHLRCIDPVIRFLQGKDLSIAQLLARGRILPKGTIPNPSESTLLDSFGTVGEEDQAKFLATHYLKNVCRVIKEGIDPRWDLVKYGATLGNRSFDAIEAALRAKASLIETIIHEETLEILRRVRPDVVGLTVPFPGNLYGALRVAQAVRCHFPHVRIVIGGGVPNTCMRQLTESRLFQYVDFVTLDDGERPLGCILEHLEGRRSQDDLFRTFVRDQFGAVRWISSEQEADVPFKDLATPVYDGLSMDDHLSLIRMPSAMQRLWSDGHWNKLIIAHGCYWKKCTFCDVQLDYVGRYEVSSADSIIDHMESLIGQTGKRGFHFVDEAAPPVQLRALSRRLIERQVFASWWTNIRFEKSFTPELVELMANAGCVAVTGGLEIASDRVLALVKKGVTVAQVARVTKAFTDVGIRTHAYLMYGFPTQTDQETIDSLEYVRQLFEEGCLQSGYWHRFQVTEHSPVGKNPNVFQIRIKKVERPNGAPFLEYQRPHDDLSGGAHDRFGRGLARALYHYMLGKGLERDVRNWFDHDVPAPSVPRDYIASIIRDRQWSAIVQG